MASMYVSTVRKPHVPSINRAPLTVSLHEALLVRLAIDALRGAPAPRVVALGAGVPEPGAQPARVHAQVQGHALELVAAVVLLVLDRLHRAAPPGHRWAGVAALQQHPGGGGALQLPDRDHLSADGSSALGWGSILHGDVTWGGAERDRNASAQRASTVGASAVRTSNH